MAFSFDDKEFEAGPEEQDLLTQTLIELEETPSEEEANEDASLADVDTRLEIADYYRAILRQSFFRAETATAKIVDREIRTFVRERLEILLGIRAKKEASPPPVESPFDEEEVAALKLLAEKVIRRPTVLSAPQIRQVSPPLPKKPTPVELAPKPQLRQVPAPAPAPRTRVVGRQRKEKAAPQPKPPPKPPPKPAADAEKQTVRSVDGSEETLVEGAIISKNGRSYKVVRNELGTLFKKDVTGQVVPPGVSRPMTPMEIEVQSRMMSEEQLGMTDETIQTALIHSLKS